MRTEMNFIEFVKSSVVSIFVSICVGIVCKDYLEIKSENLIFVFCGMSGTFSKIILSEIEILAKYISTFVKSKLTK